MNEQTYLSKEIDRQLKEIITVLGRMTEDKYKIKIEITMERKK
jgi:hypothetical protein